MIAGIVDVLRRAVVMERLRPGPGRQERLVDFWIDTGFTGDLMLRQEVAESLGLEACAEVDAVLADGSSQLFAMVRAEVLWMGGWRTAEILVSRHGAVPLLGAGLLAEHRLEIDYPLRELFVRPSHLDGNSTTA
jgi:clan AA aspartic protease